MIEQPYYTLDTSLFDGHFRYFDAEPVHVRGKVHASQERYSRSNINREITPITVASGTRHYIHMKPFVLVPDIRLTIGLYPQPTPQGAIGEVVSSEEKKMKEVEIGQGQAWYYPDQTLVIWECFLQREAKRLSQVVE